MATINTAAPMRLVEETPAYWRVVFDCPPFNIVDADIFQDLKDLLGGKGANLAEMTNNGVIVTLEIGFRPKSK